MEEDNSLKTKIKKVKVIAKDMAKVALGRPVRKRVMDRVKEIQKLTQATHEKYMHSGNSYEWITTPPKEFLAKMVVNLSGNKGEIVWETYKKTSEGDKFYRTHEVVNPETGRRMISSKSTVIDKRYIEVIEHYKPIKVETEVLKDEEE